MTAEQRKIVSMILGSIAVGFAHAAERVMEEGKHLDA